MGAVADSASEAPAFDALGARGALLAAALRAGRVPPAWIVAGPDEEASEALALEIAAHLVEPDARSRARVRERILDGVHPDVHRVRRDKPTVISVAALAEHLQRAVSTPREGARQVFVVTPADALEPEGVARYLKTLEEPPDRTTFLLVTARPDRLPTAVRSRCQTLVVPPCDVAELEATLVREGVEETLARSAAHRAGGSLARARRLVDGELLVAFDRFVERALAKEPRVTEAVAGLDAAIKACAAASPDVPAFVLVQEVARLAQVVARDVAVGAGSAPRPPGDWQADAVRTLGDAAAALGEAAAVHVATPVVLMELARRLRSAVRRSGLS